MRLENSLSLTPLGGLGEFGMNMMLVQYGDDMVVIDAGMMFPDSNMLGVDYVLPDLSYLLEHRAALRGVILTHAHEDHIGGLANLLQHVDVPVYGTDLCLALARGRLGEHGLLSKARLNEIDASSRLQLGRFTCEFVQVVHSMPATLAVVLRTPVGTIVHASDYKFDHTPVGTEAVEVGKLATLGNEGVLLLLSDSTNAEVPGYTPSERSVTPRLREVVQGARRRLIVSTFASSIHRIQQFVDMAAETGRVVAVTGRSMVNNIKVASELGYLWMPANMMVDIRDVAKLPPEQVMILTTGTQGEPLSALSLMASGSHGHVSIEEGDTVLISARIIPGHEKEVARIVNHLYRRGAEVHYGNSSGLHVSGHGSQEDLKMMLSLTRPTFFIPIHGEYRQLMLHARLAKQMGIPPKHVLVIEDGQQVRITSELCEVAETVPAGRIFVDGKMLDNLEEVVLRDRRQLSEDGMVIVVIALGQRSGEIEAEPDIVSRGFVHMDESTELIEEAKRRARDAVKALNSEQRSDEETVQEAVRLALRRFFKKQTDRRPLVLPIVISV